MLPSYLRRGRALLGRGAVEAEKVCFVMGNESADADSILSSVLLSFFRSLNPSTPYTYIPVIGCSEKDLGLRPAIASILESLSVTPTDLTFLHPHGPPGFETCPLILVDHNSIAPSIEKKYEGLGERVVEVIDHHAPSGAYPDAIRTISWDEGKGRGVGSTCTLLTKEFAAVKDLIEEEERRRIAKSLLLVIALDTVGLDVAVGKVTKEDEEAVSLLQEEWGGGEWRSEWEHVKGLKDSKEFWDKLTCEELLRVDKKRFTMGPKGGPWLKLTIPSILTAPSSFLTRPDSQPTILTTLHPSFTDDSTELLLILSFVEGKRSLAAVVAPEHKHLLEHLHTYLQREEKDMEVGDKKEDVGGEGWVGIVLQHNLKWSRKQVAPAFGRWWKAQVREAGGGGGGGGEE